MRGDQKAESGFSVTPPLKLQSGDFDDVLPYTYLRYDLVQFQIVRNGQLDLYVVGAGTVIVGDIEVPDGRLEGVHRVEDLVYD